MDHRFVCRQTFVIGATKFPNGHVVTADELVAAMASASMIEAVEPPAEEEPAPPAAE